jgi:hypothetical protein
VGEDLFEYEYDFGGGCGGVVSSILEPPTKAETNSFRGWGEEVVRRVVREADGVVLIGVSREEANRVLTHVGGCVLVRARFRIRRPRLGDVRSSEAIEFLKRMDVRAYGVLLCRMW